MGRVPRYGKKRPARETYSPAYHSLRASVSDYRGAVTRVDRDHPAIDPVIGIKFDGHANNL